MKARVTLKASDCADRNSKNWKECKQRFDTEIDMQSSFVRDFNIPTVAKLRIIRDLKRFLTNGIDIMYNASEDAQRQYLKSARETTDMWVERYSK